LLLLALGSPRSRDTHTTETRAERAEKAEPEYGPIGYVADNGSFLG
jgi:hypothetical protein